MEYPINKGVPQATYYFSKESSSEHYDGSSNLTFVIIPYDNLLTWNDRSFHHLSYLYNVLQES